MRCSINVLVVIGKILKITKVPYIYLECLMLLSMLIQLNGMYLRQLNGNVVFQPFQSEKRHFCSSSLLFPSRMHSGSCDALFNILTNIVCIRPSCKINGSFYIAGTMVHACLCVYYFILGLVYCRR